MPNLRRSIVVTVGLTAGQIAAAALQAAPAAAAVSTAAAAAQHPSKKASATPQLRQDLGEAFAAFVCRQKDFVPTEAAWSVKVVDAKMAYRRLAAPPRGRLTTADAERKAALLAKLRRFGGFAGGVCDDGHGWAIATPSPARPRLGKSGRITLPSEALRERCSSWRADFAPAQGGLPRQLVIVGDKIPTQELGQGTVSISCQPRAAASALTWFLIPIGQGPKLPHGELLPQTSRPPAELNAALVLWINRVRSTAGLRPATATSALLAEADTLTIDGAGVASRPLVEKARVNLAQRDVHLRDEQRVQGTNAHAMASSLWTSPDHRRQLLDPKATLLGLATRRIQGDNQLAVVITATSAVRTSAKRPAASHPLAR